MNHHDALRLRFTQDAAGRWVQAYAQTETGTQTQPDLLWIREAKDAAQIEAHSEAAQRSLDLTKGPLLRAVLMRIEDGSTRLLLVIHHLVVDGVSWRILLEDLQTVSAQIQRAENVALPARTDSYQRWSQQLQQYAQSDALNNQREYWEEVSRTPAALPCDMPEGTNRVADRQQATLKLDSTQTQRLLQQAPAAYRTQVNDLLLTALGRALCGWTGEERIRLDLEGHGREDVFDTAEVSRTVGWFTSVYPVSLEPAGELGESVKRVKEGLRAVPQRGLGYGVLSNVAHTVRQTEPSQVVFNYLGQLDGSFSEASTWQPAKEPSGATRDANAPLSYDLTINSQVYAGELSLTIGYSDKRYHAPTINALLAAYRNELTQLIDHCTSGETDATGITPSDFPLSGLDAAQLDRLALPWAQIDDLYPATPLQGGLLFHSLLKTGRGVYVNQRRLTLRGPLDSMVLQAVWETLIARHGILRTGFVWAHGGDALQVVYKRIATPYAQHDWAASTQTEYDARIAGWLRDDLARGFDPADAPLLRINLFVRPDGEHDLVWTDHHVLMDGWSAAQLFGEMLHLYRTRIAGDASRLPAAGSYRDYVAWLAQQGDPQPWWDAQRTRLDDPATLTGSLPAPSAEVAQRESRVVQQDVRLDAGFTARLQHTAQRYRVTLNTLIQGAWAILLARYGHRDQAVFGATLSGRENDLPGIERMLGLFINSLPVWVDVPASAALDAWLESLQQLNTELRVREATPLTRVQQWVGRSGDALFDSLIVFENYPVDEAMRNGDTGLTLTARAAVESTHYPMVLAILPGEQLGLRWKYRSTRFDASTVEQLSVAYRSILEQLTDTATVHVGDIVLPQAKQSAQHSVTAYPFRAIAERVSAQAALHPQREALHCEGTRTTYGELDASANRIGRRLARLGVRADERVGLCIERSAGMVAGLLGVLKAGAAFVPLDPAYPAERLTYMMEDAGVTRVLADAATAAQLATLLREREVVVVSELDDESSEPFSVPVHPDQLAYVIYTSGSTGRPKGVAISHRSLSLHLDDFLGTYRITGNDKQLQSSTINFDVALHEMLPALSSGGKVEMRGPQQWDLDTTSRHLADEGVTFSRIPTAYWQQWLRNPPAASALAKLRQITVGGEGLPGDALRQWRNGPLGHIRLDNLYGPTETTVACMYRETRAQDEDQAIVSIGGAYPSRRAYVIDRSGHEAPVDGLGELCIAGATLARGYLDRPAATAEKFIPDPFSNDGGRLYRTGDLCRRRADGRIDFLGRLDQQVKLRGLRIELGEIEAALREIAGVRDAVVALNGEGDGKRLVGYVVGTADETAVRGALESRLPAHMVPSVFMHLDALPVMPNGKVDRAALPAPMAHAGERVMPDTPLETQLLAVWNDVLKRDDLGVTDDFFAVGGHSLLALKVLAKAAQTGLPGVTLEALFQHPSVRTLAAHLATQAHADATQATPAANVVSMSERTDAPMVFAIHPASGLVADYRPLAAALDGVASVYGVQAPFYTEDWWPGDLSQLAADYAARIRTVQPSGPYRLIGWSVGGVIATEVARVLARDGGEVPFVGLIDAHVLSPDDANHAHATDDDKDAARYDAAPVTYEQMQTYRAEDHELQKVLDDAGRKWPAMKGELSDAGTRALLSKVMLFQRHLGHIVRYTEHTPLPVDLQLWWARHRPHRPAREATAMWAARATGSVSVANEIDADHTHIVRHSDLFDDLARALASSTAHDNRPEHLS
ncbi:non-ribosomal peptide synthetase [Paraburkholderia flava]|uniref:non-ribosomal peptide synthetase n=1 Tax=Paraburkholderia flava TaxID=2547393 RepID=UPI0023EA51E8|nr:non-ribosomal peptide synthetase [Paraburkholderia flava]